MNWQKITQAAKSLQVKRDRIYRLVKKGLVKAKKKGKLWMVEVSSLLAFLVNRGQYKQMCWFEQKVEQVTFGF
jgi:excisionase family DNA binding protein